MKYEDMDDNVENIIDCPENESGEDTGVVYTTPDEDIENVNVNVKNLADQQNKRKLVSDTREGPRFRYIGETSRSVFERGGEHKKDLKYRRPKSHMLRHCVEIHPDKEPEEVDFKMKILSTHKTPFERQIREAVMIDHYSKDHLLNSKME